MVVLQFTHYQHRTVFACSVDILNSSVIECTVCFTEAGLQCTVVSSVPVCVFITIVTISLTAIAVSTTD